MKSKKMCRGCRDDFYNHNQKDGCWSFESSKLVERVRVGIWEHPPYSPKRAEKCLSCYRPNGYAMLQLNDCRVRDEKQAEVSGGQAESEE